MVAGHLGFRDDLAVAHHGLELLDTVFQLGLLVLGRVVFRVFRKVAVGLGFLQVLGDFDAAHGRQVLVLFHDLVVIFLSQ